MKRLFVLMLAIAMPLFSYAQELRSSPPCWYFVAVHCDPPVIEPMEVNYEILRQMVHRADTGNIRLTIMLTAPWVSYITESSQRVTEVRLWQRQGHEIAAHHHGLNHGIWDGYTDYPIDYAFQRRLDKGVDPPEPYHGTLDDLMDKFRHFGNVVSGCMNDEEDKAELPDQILYDACGGTANFGAPGRPASDIYDPVKGRNEFITAGFVNGIYRSWVAHYRITNFTDQVKARNVFLGSPAWSVYGVNFHAMKNQLTAFHAYMDLLIWQDPGGFRSLTMREVIEYQILPEQMIDIAQ